MTTTAITPAALNTDLVEVVRSCYHDPLLFVRACYPWGQPNTALALHDGPDVWQAQFLTDLGAEVRAHPFDGLHPVLPIRRAVSKGHGVGGSVLIGWLVDWIMSTRPHCRGTVTANTATQLETKTWATIRRWTKLCLTGHWFVINAARMYHKDYPESWFCTPQTCRPENSEAFHGQHAAESTSFYMFDEDSMIAESIHVAAEGGLTDGEPMIFRFGNPTRNSGDFYACCFGEGRDRWHAMLVDARTSKFANQALIASWIEQHGEDSDFVRVRVRGLPPRASDLQYIDQDRVWAAQRREVVTFADEPLIAGFDVSGGGDAWNVVRFRRGLDARTRAPIRIPGAQTRDDRSALLAKLADLLADQRPETRVTMLFVDAAFGAPYVERLHTLGFANVQEVNFGRSAPDPLHFANMRAYLWWQAKEWLLTGALPQKDAKLEADLTAPGFHRDVKDRLVIESKESLAARNVAPTDDADALLLTWTAPVGLRHPRPAMPPPALTRSWMG